MYNSFLNLFSAKHETLLHWELLRCIVKKYESFTRRWPSACGFYYFVCYMTSIRCSSPVLGQRGLLQYFKQFVIGYFFPGINITAGMSNHKSAYLMFHMVKVVNFTQASAHWLMKFTWKRTSNLDWRWRTAGDSPRFGQAFYSLAAFE